MASNDVTFNIKANVDKGSVERAKKELNSIGTDAERLANKMKAALAVSAGNKSAGIKDLRDKLGITATDVKAVTKLLNTYNAQLEVTRQKKEELASARGAARNTSRRLNNAEKNKAALDPNSADYASKAAGYDKKIAEENALLTQQQAEVAKINAQYEREQTILKANEAALQAYTTQFQQGEQYADAIFQKMGVTYSETSNLASASKEANTGLNGAAQAAGNLVAKEKEANTETAKVQVTTKTVDDSLKGLVATYHQYTEELAKANEKGTDTAAIQEKLSATTDKLNEKLSFNPKNATYPELIRNLQELKAAQGAIEKMGMPTELDSAYTTIAQKIAQTRNEIRAYEQSFNGVSQKTNEVAKSADRAGSSGKKMGINFRAGLKAIPALLNTVKKGFNGIQRTADRVKSSFDGMARNMRSNFKHMITSLTKYVLGFRSLFFLVRRLRKYIGEGIQSMSKFNGGSNPVNANISKLITSLEYLKNAWATAFDPILQVVTPWLSALLDKLASVGNAFSRFLGNLLGVSKVFQAIKGPTKNYAKSLDKAGKSAGGAAKKQKKLNDRLADFDDLHVLGKDNDSPSSGGGGGSGGNNDDDKRNNKLWDFAKIKNDLKKALQGMWASADFTGLGKKISDGLVNALNSIKWSNIKLVAFKIGKSIATLLNGALGDPKLWQLSGSTVAEIINTIGTSINGFLKNIKVDFGGNFASLINALFKTIDWNQVNENIKLFGEQLVKNINSFFSTLDLSTISMDLSGLAQSLTGLLVSLIDDIDWGQVNNALLTVGGAISEGIENALKNSDNPFLQTLGGVITSIRQAAGELLPVIMQIATSVGQAFQAILPAISAVLPQVVSLIQQSATTVLPVLVSAIQTLMPVLSKIISTILPVLSQVLTALSPIFTMLAETLLPMIADAISQLLPVITPIITQLVSALVPVLSQLVTSLLPVLQGIFNAILPIIQQLLPIIMQIVQTLLPVLSQILAQILPVIQQVTEAVLPIVVKLLDIIAPLISDILTALADLVGPVLGLVSPILESITSTIGPLLDLLRPIVNIIRTVLNLVISILSPIIELIEPIMKIINDCLSPVFSLLGLIGDIIQAVVVPILRVFAGIIQAVVVPILKFLVAGIKLVVDAFGNISTAVNFVIGGFKSAFQAIGNWFKGWVNGFLSGIEGFINGFIGALNGGIKAINKLAVKIPDWVPGVGGKKLGFNIKELNTIHIPRLAQGAVIPPNNEFMAVLGDQSHGTNIEAPLDTIKQAVAEVIGNNGSAEMIQLLQQLIAVVESKNLVIGDKEIGKANARYSNQQRIIRGTSF